MTSIQGKRAPTNRKSVLLRRRGPWIRRGGRLGGSAGPALHSGVSRLARRPGGGCAMTLRAIWSTSWVPVLLVLGLTSPESFSQRASRGGAAPGGARSGAIGGFRGFGGGSG